MQKSMEFLLNIRMDGELRLTTSTALCSWLTAATTWSTLGTVIVGESSRVGERQVQALSITHLCGEAMRNADGAL